MRLPFIPNVVQSADGVSIVKDISMTPLLLLLIVSWVVKLFYPSVFSIPLYFCDILSALFK